MTSPLKAERARAERALTEELTCPVCLATYQDPVSLGCGHCFCRHCITKTLSFQKKQERPYSCPMCQAVYGDYPSLQRNLQLCSIVENYSSLQSPEPCEVPCSYCLGAPNMAVKTCLTCEVSLCQQHLEKHSSNKKGHVLLEPSQSVQERKCCEHDKLLEYYCEKDKSCICVTCYIAGSHKGHTIVTLKEAQAQKRSTLTQTADSLANNVASIAKDIGDLHQGLAKVRGNTVQLSKPLKNQSDKITAAVRSLFDAVIETIVQKEKQTVSQVTALAKQMEDKKGTLLQIIEELNTLREQVDDLIFVKDYLRIQERIKQHNVQFNTLHVLDMNADPEMIQMIEDNTSDYISNLCSALDDVQTDLSTQIQQLVWSGGRRTVPKPRKVKGPRPIPKNNCKPLLTTDSCVEPKKMIVTFGQHCDYNMGVSNSNKTITAKQINMYNTATYKCTLSIIMNCSITKNMDPSTVYFLFDVSKSINWSVGVTNGISQWYLMRNGKSLSYESNTTLLLGTQVVNTLKMQLDLDANILGFYDVSSLKEIPLLVCNCDNFFAEPTNYSLGRFNNPVQRFLNLGVGLLNGSMTLL